MSNADTAWIAIRQWHSYARRLERRHLRQEGVSWSATTIARRASACIVEIQTEHIRIEGPLKELGLYTIQVQLASDIKGEVKLWVVPTHSEETPG